MILLCLILPQICDYNRERDYLSPQKKLYDLFESGVSDQDNSSFFAEYFLGKIVSALIPK